MSFPLYPEYKDSGVEWLGEVPSPWNIEPLLAVASERDQSNEGMTESNLLSLSYGCIVQKDINSNDGLLPESFETYQIVEPDDIVFRLTDLQNDQRSLRTAIVTQRGIITSAYLAICPKHIIPQYLHYLLRSYDEQKVFYSMGGGLRQSMKYSDVKRLPLVVPPKQEQVVIATFLDHETARIDALIAEQEKLIALLKEKRQAVISHAVTKGLNPDVPMKDSGVEWLGEVPAHWSTCALKRCTNLLKDGTHLPPQRTDTGVPLLSVRNIINGQFGLLDDDSLISESDYQDLCRSFVPQGGDVLLAIVGATLGKVAMVPDGIGHFHIQRSLAIFRPSEKTTSAWLALVFQSIGFQSLLWEHTGFSAQPGIYLGTLSAFKIPLPPLAEQNLIAGHVGKHTAFLNAMVTEAEKAVTLLRERRSALISAAVTGKIDVRDPAQVTPISATSVCA